MQLGTPRGTQLQQRPCSSHSLCASSFRRHRSTSSGRLAVRAAEGEAALEPAALPLERSGNSFKPQKDIQDIMKVLPHRHDLSSHGLPGRSSVKFVHRSVRSPVDHQAHPDDRRSARNQTTDPGIMCRLNKICGWLCWVVSRTHIHGPNACPVNELCCLITLVPTDPCSHVQVSVPAGGPGGGS